MENSEEGEMLSDADLISLDLAKITKESYLKLTSLIQLSPQVKGHPTYFSYENHVKFLINKKLTSLKV